MSEWNAMTYEGKDTILRVVRERDRAACSRWPSRPRTGTSRPPATAGRRADVVGHIVDTTEGYFKAFDAAQGRGAVPEPHGLLVMSELANAGAKAFSGLPQAEMIAAAARRRRTHAGDPRAARSGRLDRLHGHPRLHGPGAGVPLRGRSAHGLRRALLGHPAGPAGMSHALSARPPTCSCRSCSRSGRARCARAPGRTRSPSGSGSRATTPGTTGSRSGRDGHELRAR